MLYSCINLYHTLYASQQVCSLLTYSHILAWLTSLKCHAVWNSLFPILFYIDTSIISLIICTCNNLQTIVMSLNHRKQYIYTQLQSFHNHMKKKYIYLYINIYLFYFKHICCIDCIHMTLQLHLPRSPTLGPYLVLGGRACYESWRRRSWTRRARNNNGW